MKAEFANRREAGWRLASQLDQYVSRPDVIVLALPRGGVPVGFEVQWYEDFSQTTDQEVRELLEEADRNWVRVEVRKHAPEFHVFPNRPRPKSGKHSPRQVERLPLAGRRVNQAEGCAVRRSRKEKANDELSGTGGEHMTTDTASDLDVQQIILDHPFFSGMLLRFVPLLTDGASLVRVGMNEQIFREGQEATHLYLLHSGRVALETFVPREGTTTVQTVEPGEAFGLSWLFPPYQWQFSARALEPSELVALDSRNLRGKAQSNPEFGYDLLMRMSKLMWQRLQNTRRRLVELYVT